MIRYLIVGAAHLKYRLICRSGVNFTFPLLTNFAREKYTKEPPKKD
jgi:hypothetical protein